MILNDPHIWWYVTRASAMIAWVLMTLSVVWGILLSTRILRRVDNAGWLQDLHRFLGGLSIIMVLLHMQSLILDGWLKLTLVEVFVPFATDYRPFAVSLGILSFYLLIAVQGSSLIMHRLPRQFWKGLHYSSYLIVVLVAFHAGLAGTDVGSLGYTILAWSLIGLAVASLIVRIAANKRTRAAANAEIWVPPHDSSPRLSPPRIETRSMVVSFAELIADDVLGVRLLSVSGGLLPVWYPGAHITLRLENGLERQYSLCGDPADRHHYDIAVLRTSDSAGGSRWIHDTFVPGMTVEVLGPLNHFELEPARTYFFIAGGIGITPLKSMIESLPSARVWYLVYVGRSRSSMTFARELSERYPDRVRIHAAEENPARLDFAHLTMPADTQVYVCGPESLVAEVALAVPPDQLHIERFAPLDRVSALPAQPLRVTFSRSTQQILVAADESLLDGLERAGMPVLGSCRKGVCGSCEVGVVEGTPEHLDSVMDDARKNSLRVMYPCVSRAITPDLVLDL
ncbi:MAG: 2Fe-2S iron-sulfur cluster-binding protein [Rhodoglobus sp.]